MHPNADRITPTRWGWIAVACGLENGEWLDPGEAAKIARTDTATLRRWAQRGLVTTIHTDPRYLKTEMEAIAHLARYSSRPNMALLRRLLNDALITERP
jgi:hypothetical protein